MHIGIWHEDDLIGSNLNSIEFVEKKFYLLTDCAMNAEFMEVVTRHRH